MIISDKQLVDAELVYVVRVEVMSARESVKFLDSAVKSRLLLC